MVQIVVSNDHSHFKIILPHTLQLRRQTMLTWTKCKHFHNWLKHRAPSFLNSGSCGGPSLVLGVLNCAHRTVSTKPSRDRFKKTNVPNSNMFVSDYNYTVNQCLSIVSHALDRSSVSEPQSTAEYIVAFALGHKTIHGVRRVDTLSLGQLQQIEKLAALAKQRIPIQYVLGEWDFCDMTLDMRPPVFIPRPETEELVGHVLKDSNAIQGQQFIEIGCGSGAISLAILKSLPQLKCVAIDRSEAACELTCNNAKKVGVNDRIQVIHQELDSDLNLLSKLAFSTKVDFLVSNPPYIPTKDLKTLQLEVSKFEDHGALHGGQDGLDIVYRILKMAHHVLKPHGSLWLEVDTEHPQVLEQLCRCDNAPENVFHNIIYENTYLDFMKRSRFCHMKYQPS